MKTIDDLKFVIVGSGASGTGYMHMLLKNCGLPTGHEAVFDPFRGDEIAMDKDIVGESSYMALPWLERGWRPKRAVVHVVRDTFSVIRSLLGRRYPFAGPPGTEIYDSFAHTHLPAIVPLLHKPLTAVSFYYLRWNERCERVSSYRVRVEDLTTVERVQDLLSVLQLEVSDEVITEALRQTPTDYNTRPRGEITPEAILGDTFGRDVGLMAARYGYSLERA